MAAPNSDYELLTEHFSYPPAALLDDIINTVNVLVDKALDAVERLLLRIPAKDLGFREGNPAPDPDALPPSEAAKAEIESGTHQLETLLNAATDKNFDVFELYTMQNILTVQAKDQPFVRLSHYRDLDFALAKSPDRPTTESVTNLRRKVQASQRLHVALEAERARNQVLLDSLRSALGVPASSGGVKREPQAPDASGKTSGSSPFGFLRDRGGLETGSADKPLTTTTEFTLSQLQALRVLSTSLRTILPDLRADEDEDMDDDGDGESARGENGNAARKRSSVGKKSWRRDRMEYVEGSSRKYLERVAGLELGPQGEVRDGDWQGEGKVLTRGEVEGLERVAATLGEELASGSAAVPAATRDVDEEDADELMEDS